jgi:hypothetical protein
MVNLLRGCLLLALPSSGISTFVTLYKIDGDDCLEVTISEKNVEHVKDFNSDGLSEGLCSSNGFSVIEAPRSHEDLRLHVPFMSHVVNCRKMKRSMWESAKLKAEAFLTLPVSFFTSSHAVLHQSAHRPQHPKLHAMPVTEQLEEQNSVLQLQESQVVSPELCVTGAEVGDAIPDVPLQVGDPPAPLSLAQYSKGKRMVLIGMPGAATP